MSTITGQPYSVAIGASKSAKDFIVTGIAALVALAGANALGLANQCPDATVTVLGVTVTLKALLQFWNNYRKNA